MTEHSNTGDDLSLSFRLKGMSGKQRLAYLWYYYKWLVLGVLLGGALLGWFVHDWLAASNTPVILNVTLVNAAQPEAPALFDGFPALYGYEEDETVYVDDSLRIDLEAQDARNAQSYQILSAQFAIGEVDVFVSDPELFGRMASNGAFLPLDALLPAETLAQREGGVYLLTDPQTGETSPCGLLLEESALVRAGYYPEGQTLVAGVGSRSAHTEAAAQMLEFLAAN